jgi:rRNA maturation RNase YbeY
VSADAILFFTEEITFTLRDKKKLRKWIYVSIGREKSTIGSINFIFCSDAYLHDLNVKYLKHDTLTDIITFDYTEESGPLSGDIFISIDRVRDNAKQFGTGFVKELHRVMIHGILHLAGYKDKSAGDKAAMRVKEDYYLSLQPEFFGK